MAAPPPSSGYTGGAETSPALVVDSLRKSYSGREVVRGVSFTAERGEVTAVLGPNGAGKTTTVECCEGLRRPDSGRIEVLGRDRLADKNAFLNAHVGVMLQDLGLPMAPTAGRVLRHVARLHDRPRDIHELADRLGLTDRLGTPVRRLSGGQRQRVALACALIGQPSLVFLDEPTSGLDPHARRETWDLIRSLRHDGITVILTSHLMDEVDALADRVIVLDDGHVVATGSPGDLTGSYEVRVTPPYASTSALEDLADALRDSLETPVSVSGPDVVVSNEHAAAPDATTMARLSKSVLDEGHDDAIIRITSMTMEDAFLSLTTTGNGTEEG